MIKIGCFFSLLHLGLLSTAQETKPKWSVGILAGVSAPIGSFGSKSANKLYSENIPNASGWAELGPSLQINVNYSVKKSFGLTLLLAGQNNKQDNAALQNDAKETLNNNDQFITTTNSWKIFRAMAGCYYNLQTGSGKFSIRPKGLIGVLKTSIPAFTFYDATTYSYSGNRSSTSLPLSFCYEIGADIQWSLSKRLFFSSCLSFYHSAPKGFTVKSQYINDPQDTKIPIECLNALAGIGIRL